MSDDLGLTEECRNYINCGEFVSENEELCENCKSEAKKFDLDNFIAAVSALEDRSFTPISDPKEIGKALRNMRMQLNQTQGFMANLFGIPVSKWSAIENAKAVTKPERSA